MRTPEFWNSDSGIARATAAILSPLGTLYGFSVQLKQRRAKPYRASARVLCVGNLTAGGSGKTPVSIAVGRMLMARGKKIAFLSRGYGGTLDAPVVVEQRHSAAKVGDECLLLATVAPTIVSRDRAAGAKLADEMRCDVIVMDDGFQNFQLEKDLSFLVVDAATLFGNGRLIPAGPLREQPARGFARADAVVLMGEGAPALAFSGPILRAELKPVAPEALHRQPVFAFAGIGRPEKFFAMLNAAGARVLGSQSFPDHHPFSRPELSLLKATAEKLGAKLVTTEKDYVRLNPAERTGIVPVPVFAAFKGDEALMPLLDRICEPRA
jgi:tetraacyldisaccharide 4'-kinase